MGLWMNFIMFFKVFTDLLSFFNEDGLVLSQLFKKIKVPGKKRPAHDVWYLKRGAAHTWEVF